MFRGEATFQGFLYKGYYPQSKNLVENLIRVPEVGNC
jgi:hypothetical protein